MHDELVALADARPRNLYLFALFVTESQLPQPETLPVTLEPAAVPMLPEAAGVPSQPILNQLPAIGGSAIGIVPPGNEAIGLPVSGDQPAAATQHASLAQQAEASQPATAPGSTGDGVGADLAAQNELRVLEHLISLAEQPPHYINVAASLEALQGSLPPMERLKEDVGALLERMTLGQRRVWKLRPQVWTFGRGEARQEAALRLFYRSGHASWLSHLKCLYMSDSWP